MGGRKMERAEGNNKIVLKVLSTLLVMYILTGAALFLLAFLLYKMEADGEYCHHRHYGNLCSVGTAGWHYYRKADENETFFVGDSDRRSIFCRVTDRIPVDEPGNFR